MHSLKLDVKNNKVHIFGFEHIEDFKSHVFLAENSQKQLHNAYNVYIDVVCEIIKSFSSKERAEYHFSDFTRSEFYDYFNSKDKVLAVSCGDMYHTFSLFDEEIDLSDTILEIQNKFNEYKLNEDDFIYYADLGKCTLSFDFSLDKTFNTVQVSVIPDENYWLLKQEEKSDKENPKEYPDFEHKILSARERSNKTLKAACKDDYMFKVTFFEITENEKKNQFDVFIDILSDQSGNKDNAFLLEAEDRIRAYQKAVEIVGADAISDYVILSCEAVLCSREKMNEIIDR